MFINMIANYINNLRERTVNKNYKRKLVDAYHSLLAKTCEHLNIKSN